MKTVTITDILAMTRKDLAGTSNISNLYCFNTLLHQRALKDCELDTNLRCCIQIPATPHPLLDGKSVPLMMPLLTY